MPIYAYQCQSCGHAFDLMQKMTDPAPEGCTACGKAEVRKQLSAAGFQLKGSGYYATDFKNSGKPKEQCAPCAAASSCPMADGNA